MARNHMEGNKRSEILFAAARLFRLKGYDATSLQNIVDEVGLAKGTFYHYFPGKQELLYEIISYGMGIVMPLAEEICASDLCPREKMRALVQNHITVLLENQDVVSLGTKERDSLQPKYRGEYIKQRDHFQSLYEQVLREGTASGEFPQLRIKVATWAILDMCNSVASWYRPEAAMTPQQLASEYNHLICDLMLKRPG